MCSIHLQHICISVNSRVTLVWTRNDLHSSWPLTFTNHCYKYNEFLRNKLRKWWIGRAVQRLGWESFTKLLRASLRFLYQTTCSNEVGRSSNTSPSTGWDYWKSGCHHVPPVYAAGSWGHVVNVPHFLGGLWKKTHVDYQKWLIRWNTQGTSSSQMTFIKDLGAPVGGQRMPFRVVKNDASAPWESEPKLPVVYSEQIVYDIPVDWLATIYIYICRNTKGKYQL